MVNGVADESRFVLPEQVIIYKDIAIPEIEGESMQVSFEHIYVCIIVQFSFVNDDCIRAVVFNKSAISL